MHTRRLFTRARTRIQKTVERVWLEATEPRITSAQKLSNRAFLAKFHLEGQAVTKESLLTHYGCRAMPAWPAPPSRLRDLRLDTGALSREELVALANDILEHRFVLRLTAPKVTAKGKIDWHVNPTSDPEWLWALNRHQWWPVLGLAYARSGDERYATAFVTQMLDWAKNCPLSVRKDEKSPMMACLVRPDGTFPQVNDGSFYWDYTQLARAGEAFGREDLIYIGTDGNQGTRPADTSVGFNDAGLYVMRSSWTKDARYLLFNAGPYGGPHGHEDKLSIEVFAFGQPFIVDSGSYTYEKADPFRTYFVGSEGHNTVLVDGQSQVRRWRKGSLNPKPARGNDATWISEPDFDYVSATYDDGYSSFSFDKPDDAQVIRDVIHTRRILFVRPDYWVIVDQLDASVPHSYQVLFHAAPELAVRVGSDNKVILETAPGGAALYLIPADSHAAKVSCLAGSMDPIQGWYSPGTRQKTSATAVIYEQEHRASTAVATLLYACPSGQSGDDINIEPLAVSGGKGLAFVVATDRGRDYLLFSQGDDSDLRQFGPYQARGIVAGIRTDNRGNILTQFESWQMASGYSQNG